MIQFSDLTGLLLTVVAISMIPFVAMVATSYAKIVVVLGLLRNALGVQQVPPNMVLNGIAILVTAYIMAPIGMQTMQTMQTMQRFLGDCARRVRRRQGAVPRLPEETRT
jgi:type III secretion protein R